MKLILRSTLVLVALYAMVFALGDLYLARHGAPVWAAALFAVLIVGLQYGLGPFFIRWLLRIDWDDAGTQLPARNREFLQRLCTERRLKMPKIGIIQSAMPNAFTFGHTPGDARIVVTTGLLTMLSPEEGNAVLAHELGHVEHWDFVVMTLAALAPLLLYQIYAFTRGSNKTRPLAIGAYICYWLSEFLVALLSRTREYYADQYSARTTSDPQALSSALVKIGYGMVRAEGELAQSLEKAGRKTKARLGRERQMAGSLALLGIANLRASEALALAGSDPADTATIMQWDFVNPWARLYELSSSHPLTALRIRALNGEAQAMQKAAWPLMPADQKIRWKSFPAEVTLWAAPFLSACAAAIVWELQRSSDIGATLPAGLGPLLVVLCGVTWIARTWFRYFGHFQPATIRELMQDMGVSQMRPRAVRLEGEILGFGVPGAFWCPDLVLRDDTGILYVLYRQSIPLARLIFAISAAKDYVGRKVVIEGWFRRGLRPYIEMSSVADDQGSRHQTISRWVQYALGALVIAAGVIWGTWPY